MPNTNYDMEVELLGGGYPPQSTDPMLYDDFVHHLTWTSVFAPLVTSYKTGSITPQIASSWSSNQTFTEWTFKIKPDCYFENGDLITPDIVAASIKRMALAQKKKGSESGVTEDLLGLSNLITMKDNLYGIEIGSDEITLRFSKPKPDLLLKIGFGLYAIVHPKQYDDSGTWLDPKIAISSGAYRVQTWTSDTLVLEARSKKGCLELHEKPLKTIRMSFGDVTRSTDSFSIVEGSSTNLEIGDGYDFLGPADSNILYLRLFKSLELPARSALRDILIYEYAKLKNINWSIVRSFLPLTIKGVNAVELPEITEYTRSSVKGMSIKVPIYNSSPKSNHNKSMLSVTDAFNEVMKTIKSEYGVNVEFLPWQNLSFHDETPYDLELLVTGVTIESAYDDIRFMFKSKEGIQLPDVDSTISPLLNDVENNVTEINQKIWDQGVIIPVTHYSRGLWFKKGIFETQDLNHMLPATNFQFIGWK